MPAEGVEMIRLAAVSALALAAVPASAGFQSPPPPPPPILLPPAPPAVPQQPAPLVQSACTAPEYRAFDFWIGEWDVYSNGGSTRIATSSIEAMFMGCAIRETWKPLKGGGGGSFSHYDKERGHWRQMWVDSSGMRVDFDGGPAEGQMVLTGPASGDKGKLTRMTFTPHADGSIRQHGEQSADQGGSWATSFDFIYRPRKAGEK